MKSLPTDRHSIYRLAPDLLLVFKPRGHREVSHVHPYRQRLRVVRGALRVATAPGPVVLRPDSDPLTLEGGCEHATEALEDTWLIAETVG